MSADAKEAWIKLFALAAAVIILAIAIPMTQRGASEASTKAGTYVSCNGLQFCPTPTPLLRR
ncbi:MAG TPA: hypothetical protein VGE07_07255 [Herpetosiphonaceae bacterium]